jgi:hypothetical protein
MLRRYEGPPEPRVLRKRRFGPVWRICSAAALGLAIATALVIVTVLQPFSGSGARTAASEAASCGASLRYLGSSYIGNRVDFAVPLAGTLGLATDTCGDGSIDVVRIVDVDPQLAVARAGETGTVYVAAGRCVGFAASDFNVCLHRSLTFSGSQYVATQLLHPLELGQPVGSGMLGADSVQVFRAGGVEPSRAVALATASGPRRSDVVYLAPDVCEFAGLEQLERCLEAR